MRYSASYNICSLLAGGLLTLLSLNGMAQQSVRKLNVDELFRLGVANSVQLKSAKIREVISDDRQKTMKIGRLPDIQVNASAGMLGQPVIFQRGMTHPLRPETPDWSQNYNVSLIQPLYQGGRIRENVRSAGIQKQIATLNTAEQEAEIKLYLLRHYLNLFCYYKQQDVLARNIEESERRLEDIRRMKKEGLVTRNDEIRSELQLTNDRLACQEAANNIILVSQQLDILLGLDESQLLCPDSAFLYSSVVVQDYDSYVQLACKYYPGMLIARQNTRLAQSEARLSKAAYLPEVSFEAGNTLARPLSSTLEDLYNNNWHIGLCLSYHLSSLYQNKHKLHEANEGVKLRQSDEEQQMQDIRIQVRTAYIRHQEAVERVSALQLSVRQASENYWIVQNRYLNQLSILTDLLDASNVRLDAELQLTVARTQAIYTWYELQQACGRL